MHKLNELRLCAGIQMDLDLERNQQVNEAREAPRRKADLKQTNSKSLKATIRGCTHSIKHIKDAINSLEKIPAIDFNGNVPRFIGELEDLLDLGGSDGIEGYLEMCSSDLRKMEGTEKQNKRKEEEEEAYAKLQATTALVPGAEQDEQSIKTEDEDIGDFIKNLLPIQREQLKIAIDALKSITGDAIIGESSYYKTACDIIGDRIEEAMHYYGKQYDGSHEEDGDKPINVSDGTSNDEQVMDSLPPTKNEAPEQLKTGETGKEETNKPHDDINTKIKVPSEIKQSLRTEIKKAKTEAERLDTRNKDAGYFYKDLAKAFEDLLGHLEGGTRYDIKQAQIFATTLMSPMLHKIPTKVWKFLTNGGETRSLKSYMQEVPKRYPITGPRNTLK